MRQILASERSGVRYPIAETLWLTAGFIVLLALGDVVIVATLALAGVAMTAAWWIRRNAVRRAPRRHVAVASVSHLSADPRGLTTAPTHAPWHRHSAA
jgi:hypothetical protein